MERASFFILAVVIGQAGSGLGVHTPRARPPGEDHSTRRLPRGCSLTQKFLESRRVSHCLGGRGLAGGSFAGTGTVGFAPGSAAWGGSAASLGLCFSESRGVNEDKTGGCQGSRDSCAAPGASRTRGTRLLPPLHALPPPRLAMVRIMIILLCGSCCRYHFYLGFVKHLTFKKNNFGNGSVAKSHATGVVSSSRTRPALGGSFPPR